MSRMLMRTSMSHILKSSQVQKTLPRIYATCMQYNVDITEDSNPHPPGKPTTRWAAYAPILNGATSIAGLYAAGEVAATGVHGRIDGPAILCSKVWYTGRVAGKAMRKEF